MSNFCIQPDLNEVASVVLERLKLLGDCVNLSTSSHEKIMGDKYHTTDSTDVDPEPGKVEQIENCDNAGSV